MHMYLFLLGWYMQGSISGNIFNYVTDNTMRLDDECRLLLFWGFRSLFSSSHFKAFQFRIRPMCFQAQTGLRLFIFRF